MSLDRRTPLKRGTGLARGTGLVRRVPLKAVSDRAPKARSRSPRGSVRAAVALVLAGHTTVAEAARVTGANPESVEARAWEEAKRLVHDRDSETCLNCGRRGTDVHHRVRRGMAGTSDPRIFVGMANLALVCRPCHSLAHKADDPEMGVKGYRLETWQSPERVPLWLAGENGGSWIWLTASGEYADSAPERTEAA